MPSFFYSKRIISGLIAGLFGLLVVGIGGVIFALSIGLIVHFALIEYFRMTEFAGIRPASKTTLLACQILLIATFLDTQGGSSGELSNAVLPIAGVAICGWLLLQPVTGSISDIAASILGLFYLGYLPSYWIRLRNLNDINLAQLFNNFPFHSTIFFTTGMIITLIACLMIVASDIGSYYFGKIFGKHCLSPISPSKTIEGAVAGVFCSSMIGFLSGLFLQCNFLETSFLCFFGFLVGFLSIVGDLIESMMKRDAGLKDSGNALPGHGGILDRIDSYLFTPSIIYFGIKLILPILNF